LEHIAIQCLDDFFKELKNRPSQGIYFYRINSCSSRILDFIKKYYDAARKSGVIIEGRIPNPDNNHLSFYNEMMGNTFRVDKNFIVQSLGKWLPRMNVYQKNAVSGAVYDVLDSMKKEGKNENMLKNAYIKFMCWLYYKFERIVSRLGDDNVPKILYEGYISNYELLLIRVLAKAGCDVVLLQYKGDAEYRKLDPDSSFSDELVMPDTENFPVDFSLQKLREDMKMEQQISRLYGAAPKYMACTNAWIKGSGLSDFKVPVYERGSDPTLYYNCYCRINGVEDKITYINELYQFQLGLESSKRNFVIAENRIPPPTVDEINTVRKQNYNSVENLIAGMIPNFSFIRDLGLQSIVKKTFTDIMLKLASQPNENISRLSGKAVYLICWLKRYYEKLFGNFKMPEIACFIYLGGCKNENEALLMRFLARLPIDVLILVPDRNMHCCLNDELLYELTYETSMSIEKYPTENTALSMGTVAYHAERELDTIMYQDTGIYRDQQYGQANTVMLKTMYEEVEQLWNTELKYRPNFSTEGGRVTIPVVCAKICGVKDNDLAAYWAGVKKLLGNQTILINRFPCIAPGTPNPVKAYTNQFISNGKLRKDVVKNHQCYQFGYLRNEVQEHMLDKLQMLINGKFIRGTFETGVEHTIIATILNLDKNLVRMIQQFDFTKINPKIVCLSLTEQSMSLEDTIIFTFLGLCGFDLAVFVPTGYQTIERFYNPDKSIFQEHQTGGYMYDLNVPDFRKISDKPKKSNHPSWREKLFRRGN